MADTEMKTWKTNGVPLRNRQIHGHSYSLSENTFVGVIVEPPVIPLPQIELYN